VKLRHVSSASVLALVLIGTTACAGSTGGTAAPAPVTITHTEQETVTQTQTTTQVAPTTTATTEYPTLPSILSPTPRTTPSTTVAPPVSTGVSNAEIRAEVGSAVDVVDRYWNDLFSTWVDDNGNPVTWWTPQLYHGDGFYDSARGQIADCDGDFDTAGNAFFCGSTVAGTGFMAWDMQFFREHGYLGNSLFYMVVAHETAHAAQTRFIHDGESPAVFSGKFQELQADCIGGAALAKAQRDGYLTIKPDLAEMVEVSHAIGDYVGDHGTPEERDSWFQRGYQSADIESCLGQRQ
jgi:predicted metalloprotease